MSASPAPTSQLAVELCGPERPLQMAEVGGALGRLRDVEMAVFSWLGRTAASLETVDEVVWASAASLGAAWRAAQLELLLPVSVGLETSETATASPGTATACALEALDALVPPGSVATATPPGNVPGLASAWYAALLTAYRYRLQWLSPAADGPLERVLERLVADLVAERRRCEAFGTSW